MSKADGPVGVVLVPVRAALATWEGDDSAGGHVDGQPEVLRTGAGSDARAAMVVFVLQLCGVDVLHAGESYPRRRSVRKVIE
jgi:hypothetical protein